MAGAAEQRSRQEKAVRQVGTARHRRLAGTVFFVLISMGSDGREEQTLITNEDNLIVYDDGAPNRQTIFAKGFRNCWSPGWPRWDTVSECEV